MMMDWTVDYILGKQLHRMFPRRVTTKCGDFLWILHGMPPLVRRRIIRQVVRNRISDVRIEPDHDDRLKYACRVL